jgi:hypothetical protein
VVRTTVGGHDREIRWAAKRVVEGGQQMLNRLAFMPLVLEPASAHLGVGTTVETPLASVSGAEGSVVQEIPVVAEAVATIRIVKWLGVG